MTRKIQPTDKTRYTIAQVAAFNSRSKKSFEDEIEEFLDDTGVRWPNSPLKGVFKRVPKFPLSKLTEAYNRRLPSLLDVDMSMVGESQTPGPIVLDADYSVIDGMHRIAAELDKGNTFIDAFIHLGKIENHDEGE